MSKHCISLILIVVSKFHMAWNELLLLYYTGQLVVYLFHDSRLMDQNHCSFFSFYFTMQWITFHARPHHFLPSWLLMTSMLRHSWKWFPISHWGFRSDFPWYSQMFEYAIGECLATSVMIYMESNNFHYGIHRMETLITQFSITSPCFLLLSAQFKLH